MELKVDRPALAGQDIDPDTFQRVWDRVMPEGSGPAVPDGAVPAQPSVPPEQAVQQQPSVPVCPAEAPPERPAPPEEVPPAGPALPPVPDCPAPPAVPDCPAETQCPVCPSAPAAPALCLGEASQGDSQTLEQLMSLAKAGAAAGRALARRASGICARALAALAADHRMAFRRLSAAYFLITGERYAPKCAAPALPASLPLALRQQFVWEQKWEQETRRAAQTTGDPCLKELYLELAQEGALHAGTIRSLLEQMG